jgi:glycosyltransferase involved in cell wall biosynthesis
MTTLNLVLDEMLTPVPTGLGRYAGELAGALIDYAPKGCFVEGIVSASTEQVYAEIGERLPGLGALFKSALTRRDLTTAWQHGFTPVPSGMIHAPSLFAPLRNHDRVNGAHTQIAVTIHDVTAWTHPEFLAPRQVNWTKAMAQRAFKYADAVVVPTHAIAAELAEILPFGDRLRVLGAAVASSLVLPGDDAERAARLELPERYLLTSGNGGAGSGLPAILAALALHTDIELPLLVIGAEPDAGAVEAAVLDAGLPPDRVRVLPQLSDEDLSVVVARAAIFLYPTLVAGFGMPMLEAFHFGVPVIHSDAASLVEVAGDAGITVPGSDSQAFPGLLGDALANLLADRELRERLALMGTDRARLFTWRASAEGVWQLHADL